jgi:tRNA(fMet)-specific endonuclease VapC
MHVVPFDHANEAEYQQLRAQKTGVGTQDLKIAAVALTNHLILVSRNGRDFSRVPGIRLDDWSI